jgi:leucyl aminopeptidase
MLEVQVAGQAPEGTVAVGVPVTSARGVGSGGTAPDAPPPTLELLVSPSRLSGRTAGVAASLLPEQADVDWLRRQGFGAKAGQTLVLRTAGGPPSVVLVGLGEAATVDAERWRLASAGLVRAAGEGGGTAALLLPSDPPGVDVRTVGTAVAEGAVLAAYRFDAYRTSPSPAGVARLVVVADPARAPTLEEGVRRGSAAAAAVSFARDLVNTPAGDMTPARLADRVVEHLAGLAGTTVEVWDEQRVAAEHLGGLQAVARGSDEPPRLVRASYEPETANGRAAQLPHVVLVGKGITFDSGGLSLKPADGMMTMKTDMTGAAVVLAVVAASAALGPPVRVTAIAPITENMPGARAQKPGDVFRARNGMTVEVLNTDAEGRLVLADGLSLAAELAPDAIVDVATLTGAQVVALGTGMAAVLGTDEALVGALRDAGQRSGERLWPLPLPEDYDEHIESEVADMKNIGRTREAGTIAAAMLLKRFVGTVPWAHLDIAGPARASETAGYVRKGATAFGVRVLLDFLDHYRTPR